LHHARIANVKKPEYNDLTFVGIQGDRLAGDGIQREGRCFLADLEEPCGKHKMRGKHWEQDGAKYDGKTFHEDLQEAMSK